MSKIKNAYHNDIEQLDAFASQPGDFVPFNDSYTPPETDIPSDAERRMATLESEVIALRRELEEVSQLLAHHKAQTLKHLRVVRDILRAKAKRSGDEVP